MVANIATAPSARRHRASAEVNVTPFVDVMLVLLIVFMVAAPLATVAIPLDLNGPKHPPAVRVEPVFLSLQANGTINVGTQSGGETAASWSTFSAALHQKTGGDPNRQILIRADQRVPYAAVMRLMDELHRTGYRSKMLVTEDVVVD